MARLTGLLGLLLISTTCFGVTRALNTMVLGFFSDISRYGGCMANLEDRPDSVGLACTGSYVTFSCSGDFAGKDAANRNFEIAQMAYLMGRRVRIYVDDTRKHNGFCLVQRIDMLAE